MPSNLKTPLFTFGLFTLGFISTPTIDIEPVFIMEIFLASDLASGITGVTLPVDGGMVAD